MFSGVCKPWRSIAQQQQQQQHPPCNLPWLLMPSTAATSLFCVVSEDTHRPGLLGDARCARFCGSFPGAWLAAELPESRGRGPVLLDLCTGECVALPRGCEAGESSSADSASSPSTTSGRGPPCPLCMYFLVLARNLVLMVIRFVSTRETAFDALQAGARRRAAAASLEEARNRRP
uniref:Uncharacterized protein n=1 Tax=Oryza nivara TaxID=4536 RepID=A0A0E0G5L2_ORYNI